MRIWRKGLVFTWRMTVAHLVTACAAACAPPAGVDGEDERIPLLPYFRELRTIRAALGSDTLTLLFDTGGGATSITPEVAAKIGCDPYGRDVGHRMSGERVEFQRCDSLTIHLGNRRQTLEPIAVFDVNALLPAELPRLDGVLALDAFRGLVVTVDWPGAQIVVHTGQSGESAMARFGVPTRVATGEEGGSLTLFTLVPGRRGSLWFLLDSGNLAGTLIDRHVLRDSLLILDADTTLELRIGRGSPFRSRPIVLDLIIDGAIGTAFLQRGPVSLDLRKPGT